MQDTMVPIDMITSVTKDGLPTPIRYRVMMDDGRRQVIPVDRILERTETTANKVRRLRYRCRSDFNGLEKEYELTFEVQSMRWYVSKM